MSTRVRSFWENLGRIAKIVEDTLLVLLLAVMIGLAAFQIFQRNILGTGFVWTDEFLRMMVLAVALVGALAASRDDNHINIDVITRFLHPRPKLIARVLVNAFTAVVCCLVAWHSVTFVAIEREAASIILGGFPSWIFQSIIPLCFGLIAWRYLVYFLSDLIHLIKGERPQ